MTDEERITELQAKVSMMGQALLSCEHDNMIYRMAVERIASLTAQATLAAEQALKIRAANDTKGNE